MPRNLAMRLTTEGTQMKSQAADPSTGKRRWYVHYTGSDGIRTRIVRWAYSAEEAEQFVTSQGNTVHAVEPAPA